MWITLIIYATTIFGLYLTPKLSLYRNYFFLIMLLQAFMYINFSPTIVANAYDESTVIMYFWMQLLCIFFFEAPFIFIYLIAKKTIKNRNVVCSIKIGVNNNRQLVFTITMLLIACLFAYIVLSNDLIFNRIGSENKAFKFVKLSSSISWWIYRELEKSSFFLIGVLLLSFFAENKPKLIKVITTISLLSVLIVFGAYYLINTRLTFALLGILILGLILFHNKSIFFKKRLLLLLVLLILAMSYSMKLASNIRGHYSYDRTIRITDFIPLTQENDNIKQYNSIERESLTKRMDGIDLMVRTSLLLNYNNIPLGEAWKNPIFMVIGPFIDREKTNELKLKTDTNAKNYIMRNFTDIKLADYYSCMLTDVYGNFWIFGLVFAAIILAFLCAYIDNNLLKPKSSTALILSVYLASIILPFEQEFISIFSNFVQTLPILLCVLIFNPLKVRRYIKNHENSNHNSILLAGNLSAK